MLLRYHAHTPATSLPGYPQSQVMNPSQVAKPLFPVKFSHTPPYDEMNLCCKLATQVVVLSTQITLVPVSLTPSLSPCRLEMLIRLRFLIRRAPTPLTPLILSVPQCSFSSVMVINLIVPSLWRPREIKHCQRR